MEGLKIDLKLQRPGFRLQLAVNLDCSATTVLLGPSGGGKSTLLRALVGLERPLEGCIALGDRVWFDSLQGIDLPTRQRRAGLVFQHYALFPSMTVAQNIGFAMPELRRAARRTLVAYWLERLRISDIANAYPSRISGGQRQRVALARALAAEPDVLLLDEPFSAVDAELRQHMRQLFQEVVSDSPRPLLLVTHDLDDARELGDRIGVLVEGDLRRYGVANDVFTNPQDLDVARVLGWRNLLPVDSFEQDLALASWGYLNCRKPVGKGRFWLGIEPRHLKVASNGKLSATVERGLPVGPYHQITCRLRDGRRLYLYRRDDEAVLNPGDHIKIWAPEERIMMFRDRSHSRV